MKEDEGLAPVVAVMLILAILVTFLSVYYASVLPTLKAESEINHLRQVEESFSRLDTIMNDILSQRQMLSQPQKEATFKVAFPLGGGDVFIDSTRSAGTIWINPNPLKYSEYINISVNDDNKNYPTFIYNLSNITYTPDHNFWLNQGYSWQYGYVNVTQGSVTTPLLLNDMTDAQYTSNQFDRLFIPTIFCERQELINNNTSTTVENISLIFTSLEGKGANLWRSGNGIQTLNITRSRLQVFKQENITGITETNITFFINDDHEMFNVTNNTREWGDALNISIWNSTSLFRDTNRVSQLKDSQVKWTINPNTLVYLNVYWYNITITLE